MRLQGEGVAYRGRVLVELSTKLEGKADKTIDSINNDDILVVQVRFHVPLPDGKFEFVKIFSTSLYLFLFFSSLH